MALVGVLIVLAFLVTGAVRAMGYRGRAAVLVTLGIMALMVGGLMCALAK